MSPKQPSPDASQPSPLARYDAEIRRLADETPPPEGVSIVAMRAAKFARKVREDAKGPLPDTQHTKDREAAKVERRDSDQLGRPVAPADEESLALAGIQSAAPPRDGEGLQRLNDEQKAAGNEGLADSRAELTAAKQRNIDNQ